MRKRIQFNIASNTEKEDVLTSAKEIFYDLIGIYESLYPFEEKDLKPHYFAKSGSR